MKNTSLQSIFSRRVNREENIAIVNSIIDEAYSMEELMECFFSNDLRICQRAAWPVGMIAEKAPQLLDPYIAAMLENLEVAPHDAVVRNTLRAWQFMDIPEELESAVYDKCLQYLSEPSYPIAISVFGMTVCSNIAMKYPELKEEVIAAIDYRLPHGSAGMRSRGMKLRKKMLNAEI